MFDSVTSDPQTQELIRLREKGHRDFISAIAGAEIRGMEKGRMEGRMEGMEKGLLNGKIEAAASMLVDDLPIETIEKYTGLSKSEILKLK
jgi:predicted transposase/invertase (TIGR01784 family)